MKTASIISYIVAGIIILFSILLSWSAFDPNVPDSRLISGLAGLAIGFGFIYAGTRFNQKAKEQTQITNINIDLPGNVQMDVIKCQACGAPIDPNNIQMVNGAPVLKCNSCGTTYQLTEEPKW